MVKLLGLSVARRRDIATEMSELKHHGYKGAKDVRSESMVKGGKVGKVKGELTFRGHSCTNFNIWFFDDHPTLYGLPTRATVFRGEHPFSISVCETVDWDDADACSVVTAVSGSEANTPTSLCGLVKSGCDSEVKRSLTRSCISSDLYLSMPSFADMASPRVNILTKAWRLSTFTMQV